MPYRTPLTCLCLILLLVSCTSDDGDSGGVSQQSYEDKERNINGCGFENGVHSATVEYYNPSTGHSATYTLDVDVEDCEVTVIHFPNGGWLDDSHITPAELDEDGDVELEDEEGRTFSVHIEN